MKLLIKCRQRGPITLTGDLSVCEIYDANGERLDLSGRSTLSLCRCGASASKPLCDGSHNRIGFEAPASSEGFEPEG